MVIFLLSKVSNLFWYPFSLSVQIFWESWNEIIWIIRGHMKSWKSKTLSIQDDHRWFKKLESRFITDKKYYPSFTDYPKKKQSKVRFLNTKYNAYPKSKVVGPKVWKWTVSESKSGRSWGLKQDGLYTSKWTVLRNESGRF